jgi:hypothetical protein
MIFEWALKGNKLDVLVIDPWNRLDSQRHKDELETEYIASCSSTCGYLRRNNCHVRHFASAKRDARYRNDVPNLKTFLPQFGIMAS